MELRWYETYDENGVESGSTLQYRNEMPVWQTGEWEDVPYIRERKVNEEEEKA